MWFLNVCQSAPFGGKFQVCIFLNSCNCQDFKYIYTWNFPVVGEIQKVESFGVMVSRHKFFVHEWLCQLEHYVMTCTIETQYFSTHHGTENCFQRIFIANHCYCNAGTFVVIVDEIFFFPLILFLPCRLYAEARHTRTSLINLGGLAGRMILDTLLFDVGIDRPWRDEELIFNNVCIN